MLEALIFDVDGTLADTEEAHRQAFNSAFQEYGLTWSWDAALYRRLLRTTGGKERMAAYLSTAGLSQAERQRAEALIPALHRSKTAFYTQRVRSGAVPLRSGVTRLLEEAEARGTRLGIATTTSFDNIAVLLQSALGTSGLQRFSAICAGDEVGNKKPAPDVYLSVLQKLGVAATHCVAVEDSANGLASAHAAGLFTVVTPCYWTEHEDLSHADLLLSSLGDPSAPLGDADADRVGARWLGLSQLDRALSARSSGQPPGSERVIN